MRRNRRRALDSPFDIQLPITPMLDMSFQLLFFFVVNSHATGVAEGQLDVVLPRPLEPKAKDPTQIDVTRQTSAEPDDAADVTVSLAATGAGELASITVRDKSDKMIPGAAVTEMCRALTEELQKLRAGGGNQSVVKIEASPRLKYARVVDAMDACLAAGYRRIGFAPPAEIAESKP